MDAVIVIFVLFLAALLVGCLFVDPLFNKRHQHHWCKWVDKGDYIVRQCEECGMKKYRKHPGKGFFKDVL